MAFKLADALVFLGASDQQLQSDLRGAETKTRGWAGKLGGSVKGLLTGVVAGAGAAAVGAVAAVGTAAFSVSKDVNAAATQLATTLGVSKDVGREYAEIARDIFGANFADNIEDAATAVGQIVQAFDGIPDEAIQGVAESAFKLREAFGVETEESISAVKTLMDNFGISSERAFDLLTAGFQGGLNRSGDFLDTIEEYSTQFASGGASAEEFFGLLDSGLQGGMLGTDKAADAFKEFRLRIQDGSQLTADSLAAIGLNAEEITAGLSSGALTAADAWNMVMTALQTAEDPVTRFNAGVGLIGSQFEDLGDQMALNLDLTADWAEGTEGAINTLNARYETFGAATRAIWRRIIVSASPVTDLLLGMVNDAMPKVIGAFDAFDAAMGPVIETLTSLINYIKLVVSDGDTLNDWLTHLPAPLQTVAQAIGNVINWFRDLGTSIDEDGSGRFAYFKNWLDTNLPLMRQLVENILGAIQGFWQEHGDMVLRVVTNTFNTAFTVIDTVIKNILDVITLALQLMTGDWEGAMGTLQGMIERTWNAIQTVFHNQIDSIKAIFTDFDWAQLGGNIIDGIASGIRNTVNRITDAARNAAQSAYDAARNWLGIRSPSRKAQEEIGKPFAEGIAEGARRELGRMSRGINGGLTDLMRGVTVPQVAGAAASGPVYITINVQNGTAQNVENGLLSALRRAGLSR